MQFDLSAIPTENVEILEASLELYGAKHSTFANGKKVAKPIIMNWLPNTANWNMPWSKKGGSATTSNQAECGNTTFNSWDSYDVTAAVFERHLKDTFYGFLIDVPGDNQGISYHSSESGSSDFRPKLTVKYRILEQEAPAVTVTSPNSGSEVAPHDETTIEWIASDNVGVEYQKIWIKDGGSNPVLIDSIDGAKRDLTWETPCVRDSLRIIVQAFDEVGNVGIDTSDYFSIIPDTVANKGSDALMSSADWYGGADTQGSKVTFDKGDSVSCSMTLTKKTGSEYPWVNLTAQLHSSQKLSGTRYIKVVYTASKPLKMNLQDPDLAGDGLTHSTVLPRSTSKRCIYLHVDSCFFAQPDWCSNKSAINLEKVVGVSFEPDADPQFGGSVNFEIFEMVLYGYSGTIGSISQKNIQPGGPVLLHTGTQLVVKSAQAGLHRVKLYQLNGVELYSASFTAEAGSVHTLPIEGMHLADKIYLLHLEVGGTSLQKIMYLQ